MKKAKNFFVKAFAYYALVACIVFAPIQVSAYSIFIDTDVFADGIQPVRTVDVGETFFVALIFQGDGQTTYDAFAFDLQFNDNGTVLDSNSILSGELATLVVPPITLGSDLPTLDLPPFGTGFFGAYTDSIGGSFFTSQDGTGIVADGDQVTAAFVEFGALAAGSTSILPFGFLGDGDPGQSPNLDAEGGYTYTLASGLSQDADSEQGALITVIPEPSTYALISLGLVVLLVANRRRLFAK